MGAIRNRLKQDDLPNRASVDRRTDAWKDSQKVSGIMKRLKDHADGKLDKPLDQTQIKAYEVILDRLVPKLSAVEQTLADPNASKTEEQMVEELVQAFTSLARKRPEVLRRAGLAFKPVAVAQHGAAHTLDENDSALAS